MVFNKESQLVLLNLVISLAHGFHANADDNCGHSISGDTVQVRGSRPNRWSGFSSTFLARLPYEEKMRLAHGVLACVAWGFLFPMGSIIIRTLPTRAALWLHIVSQMFAYVLYAVAFGIGVYLTQQFSKFHVLGNIHPIVGIVIFGLFAFQPILGVLHHLAFKKYSRRTFWSHAHLWIGRITIILGIINGGLGFKLSHNTKTGEITYAIVAATMSIIWVAASLCGELKSFKSSGTRPPTYKASTTSTENSLVKNTPNESGLHQNECHDKQSEIRYVGAIE